VRPRVIFSNDALEALEGLGSLTTIGDGVGISGNHALEHLEGLSLRTIGGGLLLQGKFADLEPLSDLVSVGGGVHLRLNLRLNDLHGLRSLERIGGTLMSWTSSRADSTRPRRCFVAISHAHALDARTS
jgi:hypothetical protein